ncbi:MAG TPA: glycoside hydrolase family 99-like domain-containing protein, partial [bacterium]|nr:glycoside hydrolase family 99-like domain-containing protein [bacterium]
MKVDFPVQPDWLAGLEPAGRQDFSVAAIYFPGFHPTPFFEKHFGPGWSEWELVRSARPRFPGHRQPLEPLWGCYDESDPAWAEREIEAAAGHGIDIFIFDWYWYQGVEILNEALERGFLAASNRNRLRFGLMWANHTIVNVFPAPVGRPPAELLPIVHTPEDLDRVIDHCARNFFVQPNYWFIEGKPWFGFFNLGALLKSLGGLSGAAAGIERMRRRAERAGFNGLYLGGFTGGADGAETFRKLGFDHVTTYNIVTPEGGRPGRALNPYREVAAAHPARWREIAGAGLPCWPVVTQGWDVSPRNSPGEPWPPARWEWPFGALIPDNSPELFGRLCSAARRFLSGQPGPARVMLLNAWNEWTESSVLAPTRDQGFACLEALREA